MFQIGEVVAYGATGICKIEDIRTMSLSRSGSDKQKYYVLCPMATPTCVTYVPADNAVLVGKMRPVYKKDEIDHLIETVRGEEFRWIEDTRKRMDTFSKIVSQGISTELLKLIACLYLEKKGRSEAGKKFCATDEKTLKSAERIVGEEFSYALNIPQSEVSAYIANKLK